LNTYTGWKKYLPPVAFYLILLALASTIIAIARPQKLYTKNIITGKGIDIILCFDISGSMTEKDFTPNRLAAAKAVAKDFVNNRNGDRIGITIFSNKSFTLCPLTNDYTTVNKQIDVIESGYLNTEGTAIGSGIATSVSRLKASDAVTKIIILLTDGADAGGLISPTEAAEMATEAGIKIYTIGIGSNKIVEEIVTNEYGSVVQKKQAAFNENILKNIATATGAQYFQAFDEAALAKVYASINQLEKSTISSSNVNKNKDIYLPFLYGSFICLLIAFALKYIVTKKFLF